MLIAMPVRAEASAARSLHDWAGLSPGVAAVVLHPLELPLHSTERAELLLPALHSYPRSLVAHVEADPRDSVVESLQGR